MRLAILVAAPLIMGFGPAQQAPAQSDAAHPLAFDMPGYSRPAPPATGDLDDFVRRATCRDTIEHAREANGQPPLERLDDAAPQVMLFKAVDQEIDGCDVLVMAEDTDDIRPVPRASQNRARIIPAD